MTDSASILKLIEVTIESAGRYESGVFDVSFELAAGELIMILLEQEHLRLPLMDAAEGLVTPAQGKVAFQGKDWRMMTADQAAAHRGKIGRVFEDQRWLRDLPLDQNITLAQCHHTRRPEREIEEEATNLARIFGLPGLPRSTPATMRRQDLRKAACVRALLGTPVLILLENPTYGAYADLIAPLLNTVRGARNRGAAVVWTTLELEVWNNPGLRATQRGKMVGSQLQVMREKGEVS